MYVSNFFFLCRGLTFRGKVKVEYGRITVAVFFLNSAGLLPDDCESTNTQ